VETFLYKLITKDKQARIYLLDNTLMLKALKNKFFKSDVASDVFYTAVTFCCHLHGMMINAKRVSIKLNTSDPLAFLSCGADADGNIQGYASDNLCEHDYADLAGIVGEDGCLKIIQDNGLGTIFTGIVEIRYNDIADNFAHYFLQSEQTQTVFRYFRNILGTKVSLSRGVMIQALPFAENTLVSGLENRIELHADTFSDPKTSIDIIMQTVFSDAEVLECFPVRIMCTCGSKMILKMLLALGASDLQWTLNDEKAIEVRCDKCGKKYLFNEDDIRSIM